VPRAARIPADLANRPFNLNEAREHGLTKHHLVGAQWRRLGGGYYASSAIADAPMVRLTAALRRLPDGAVLSGRSAAFLHGLDYPPCSPIEVTIRGTSRFAGLAIRRNFLVPEDIVMRKGLRVTSPLRTVVDLVSRLTTVEGVVALDAALHKRLLRLEQVRAWADVHPRHRGVAKLRRAIDLAEPKAESPMETRLRLVLVLAGLPRPRVQVSLGNEDTFLGRADLYYAGPRLIIEYDGGTHRDRLAYDDRRQNRLVDAGYRLLRFTAADILESPDSIVALVRRNLALDLNFAITAETGPSSVS